MRFNHSIRVLTRELDNLYDLGEGLPTEIFENSILNEKIVEIDMAIRILKNYVFKPRELEK